MLQQRTLTTALIIITILAHSGAQMVAKAQKGPWLLKGGTVHTVSNGTIPADVLIEGEKIVSIGTDLTAENATVVDCTDKHIYPGFIDGGTYLGLGEISAVSLTQDMAELGDFTPNMKALTAVNPNSVNIPVTRTNGVTTVLTQPRGGQWPGTAAVIDLYGYTPQRMYAGFEAVRLVYPATGKRGRWDRRSAEDIKKAADKAAKKLNKVWDEAVAFSRIDSAAQASNQSLEVYNPELAALLPAVRGEAKLLVEVNKKTDILSAIDWCQKRSIDAIFTGVSEGWRVADSLAASGYPCIVGPILSLPNRDYDRYDTPYRNASLLAEAGVPICIRTLETENVRNLPFNAGFAAAYGLGTEAAVRAITLDAASILGISDTHGSIDPGKYANCFVVDGDPFEMKSRISHLFIRGMQIPIENRHTLLYDEFLNRDSE